MASNNYRQIKSEDNITSNNINIRTKNINHIITHKSGGYSPQKYCISSEDKNEKIISINANKQIEQIIKEKSLPKESRKCSRNSCCNVNSNSNSNEIQKSPECCQLQQSTLSYIRVSNKYIY